MSAFFHKMTGEIHIALSRLINPSEVLTSLLDCSSHFMAIDRAHA